MRSPFYFSSRWVSTNVHLISSSRKYARGISRHCYLGPFPSSFFLLLLEFSTLLALSSLRLLRFVPIIAILHLSSFVHPLSSSSVLCPLRSHLSHCSFLKPFATRIVSFMRDSARTVNIHLASIFFYFLRSSSSGSPGTFSKRSVELKKQEISL